MKKLALTALAAAMATLGLASVASADSRYGDDEWRHRGQHERNSDRRDNHDSHSRWNDNRRDDGRWHHRDGRRYDPRRPHFAHRDYCFVKKIRRVDDWGNVYIKRVRICR
jgi:hypothetical protein